MANCNGVVVCSWKGNCRPGITDSEVYPLTGRMT